jgi:hypothetical protein
VTEPHQTLARGAVRTVRLPEGGTLVVRLVEARDVDAIASLYAHLDAEAAYRRFFSGYRPDHEFFDHLVAVGARGGAGLVAEVDAGPEGPRVVGEASYERLANGNGELAITVDGTWRGWLGPYLLDALLEVAAGRGVPNLEADVLLTNGPMLALLRSRGYAALPTSDWSVVRAVIGAATRRPTWPAARTGLRVLVEGAGGHWPGAEAATAAGIEVLGCSGPATPGARCPALAGEPCPLATGSDVIVLAHPADSEEWRALRDAHPAVHPGVPVCVELPGAGGGADVVTLVQRLAREPRGGGPGDAAP